MGDGYFYALSAIAQSFAAIVALNAIFVIYKLQLLKNRRDEVIKKLRQLYRQEKSQHQSPRNLRDISSKQEAMMTDEQILSFARGYTKGPSDLVKKFNGTRELFDKIEKFVTEITKWFKRTLWFNGTTILLSLILLPWKNLFPNFLQCILVVIVLLLVIFALLLTIHAILFTIELPGLMIIDRIFGKKNKS